MEGKELNNLFVEIGDNNELSFRVFYDHFFPRFFRIAHYYIRNNENAEEVVLDVFTKFWNNRKKLSAIKNFKNYAFTAVKNHSLNYLKKNKVVVEELDEYQSSKLIEYTGPEKIFIGRELAGELEKAVSKLPPRCQLIFRMVREDGMKYREVADALNMKQNANQHMDFTVKTPVDYVEVYEHRKSRVTLEYK